MQSNGCLWMWLQWSMACLCSVPTGHSGVQRHHPETIAWEGPSTARRILCPPGTMSVFVCMCVCLMPLITLSMGLYVLVDGGLFLKTRPSASGVEMEQGVSLTHRPPPPPGLSQHSQINRAFISSESEEVRTSAGVIQRGESHSSTPNPHAPPSCPQHHNQSPCSFSSCLPHPGCWKETRSHFSLIGVTHPWTLESWRDGCPWFSVNGGRAGSGRGDFLIQGREMFAGWAVGPFYSGERCKGVIWQINTHTWKERIREASICAFVRRRKKKEKTGNTALTAAAVTNIF